MPTPKKPAFRSHRDLVLWQIGMKLVKETYSRTEGFPDREKYGLVAQMRKASISIPANTAEGYARSTTRDFLRFLAIVRGSLRELDTYCDISQMLKYATKVELKKMRSLIDETARILTGLYAALRRRAGIRLPDP